MVLWTLEQVYDFIAQYFKIEFALIFQLSLFMQTELPREQMQFTCKFFV